MTPAAAYQSPHYQGNSLTQLAVGRGNELFYWFTDLLGNTPILQDEKVKLTIDIIYFFMNNYEKILCCPPR